MKAVRPDDTRLRLAAVIAAWYVRHRRALTGNALARQLAYNELARDVAQMMEGIKHED